MRSQMKVPFLLILILFLILTLARSNPALVTAREAASAPAGPSVQQTNLPPALISSDPSDGATTWRGGPVTFTFDQPLSQESTVALHVDPALDGTIEVEGATMTFTPEASPQPGQRYRFTIDVRATATSGTPLSADVSITLEAAVPLQVTSTQPSSGSVDVATNGQIVIVFNQPVVALVGVDDQAALPNPLTFEPTVDGQGEWLNTSIYTFRPTHGLAGATTYTAIVADLTSTSGAALSEAYIFSFTTAAPIVTSANPTGELVRPDTAVTIEFSQPMDRASTEAAFSLITGAENVAGEFSWNEASTSLLYTPTAMLDFGARYTTTVSTAAQPASQQGNLRDELNAGFTVVPLPAVANTTPGDGTRGVPPEHEVTIKFSAPVSRTLVLENIHVTPVLTTTQVYSYYSEYEQQVTLGWFKEPNTAYTITVGADIADEWGNTLGDDHIFTFTTGDYGPINQISLNQFTHLSAYTETAVSLLYRNVESVEAELFRLPLSELLRLTGENQYDVWQNYTIPDRDDNRVWARSYAPRVGPNVAAQQVISMTDSADNRLAPGLYMLEVPQVVKVEEGMPAQPRQAVIVLGNVNMVLKKSPTGESLVWMTDLVSGVPLIGKEVQFYAGGNQVGTATTNEDGIATARLGLPLDKSWLPVLAISGEPGDDDFAVVSSEWNEGIGVWEFNIPSGFGAEQYRTHYYTDRPIYRPGQTVYWKGIVRALVDDQYELPPTDLPINIMVRDDRGNTIQSIQVTPNLHGTVNGQVELAPDAVTGYYYIEAPIPISENNTAYGGVSFQVASYRKPEFEIAVTTDKEEYVQDETIAVTVQADYFSGGALSGAPVTWRVLAEPYTFQWADAPEDRYYSFQSYDPERDDFDPFQAGVYGLVQEGVGTTDAEGRFTLELPADIADVPQSVRWTLDVTVQSPTNQFVSGRISVPIHKSAFYIGLSPRDYVVQVGDTNTVDLVTVTPQGEAYPGAELEVVVSEFRWNSVYEQAADGAFRWRTSVERTPILTETVTTDRQGMANLTWTPERGGQYQILASGTDDAGHQTNSAAYVYVSDQEFVAWPRDNNDRMELVADRKSYQPGDTAQILVPSPFTAPVDALVTIERGGVLEARVVTLTSNSETIEIPISADYIPNVYVSVLLVKGIDETNPVPAMRIGYAELTVDIAQKELALDVQPSASEVKPGETVSYTLTVRDSAGTPVPNAEVSVAVVDKAIFTLSDQITPALLDVFYARQPLGVNTGALLVINEDRISQQLTDGAKGGGGGGGPGLLDVREDFQDVALWRANLTTDADGVISFSVPLPDNLTTWRLVARAVSDDTKVGEAAHDVVATKELQIRPLLPRFFTAGDEAQISAVLINTSDRPIEEGQFSWQIDGSSIVFETSTESFSLDPGAQTRFDLPISADGTFTEVVVSFQATALHDPSLSDAIELRIPMRRYETPEVVSTAGAVSGTERVESIRLPANATDNGDLLITLEPSLAAGMLDGLTYLEHYPYECNEQTVSRFLPNLLTVRALRTLNLPNPELESKLSFQLGVAVQRLISRQNGDGGWGYWPGEESTPFISAYVLWGLWHAQDLDYTVSQNALDRAVEYLDLQFKAPTDVQNDWELNEMAFMHFVLAEMGEGDPGRASTLFDVRERLAAYGQAYLAMALAHMAELGNTEDARVETLLDSLFVQAQLTATGAFWQEEGVDYWTLNTDTRSTAVVLAAFARLDPDEPMLPNVVRWLMDARRAGRWATTQENAWALIGLTDWLDASGERTADYDWSVTLNGAELGSGAYDASNLANPVQLRAEIRTMLREEANALLISRSNESGRLYYTTHLRYYLDALAIDARDRGLVVDRRFATEEEGSITSATIGDVISVTTTIIAPADRYHVLVEVPIPAGTEPIDVSLATESDLFGGPEFEKTGQEAWWSWQPTYTDLRDDRVALFATWLPAGTYQYTFQVRATVTGEYRVLPVYAEQMYFNEVWGRSAGALFVVHE